MVFLQNKMKEGFEPVIVEITNRAQQLQALYNVTMEFSGDFDVKSIKPIWPDVYSWILEVYAKAVGE